MFWCNMIISRKLFTKLQYCFIIIIEIYKNLFISEITITKDNPAFSMINDSDEDVIYGSDEESRRPLNRPHNDDDSD